MQCGNEFAAVSKKKTRRRFEGGVSFNSVGDRYRGVAMSTMLPNRRSTFGISCVRCNEELITPDKSEYRAGTHIRHLWHCPNCSARFQSIEQIPVETMTTDDIFPALLVA
jgi:hypothetical protein